MSRFAKRIATAIAILVLAAVMSQLLSFQNSLGGGSAGLAVGRPPSRTVRIVLVSAKPSQTVLGIGASGAWWSGPIYSFGSTTRRQVGRLLFAPSGLHLSDFRFNIGGGGVGVTTPWKAPANLVGPKGSITLSKDVSGLYFLEQAHSYGVRTLTAFVNSAPPEFVSNHRDCGGYLLASKVDAFARYLTDVSVTIHRSLGIDLTYISPMNEPDGSQKSCRQEGMEVSIANRARLVVALGRDLAESAPWSKVMADESSTIVHHAIAELPKWAYASNVKRYLAVVAHHGYDFPTDQQLSMFAAVVRKIHRPSWSTEICCFDGASFGYQYDPTMTSGIWLAHYIYQQFAYAGDSGFDWWTALSPDLGCSPTASPGCFNQINALGRNDGLLYYDLAGASNSDKRLYATKRYYVLGNFSRYLRPGFKVHRTTGYTHGIEALVANKGSAWVAIVIDPRPKGGRPIRVDIQLPLKGTEVPKSVSGVVTSATQSWATARQPSIVGTSIRCVVDSQSVTTYTIQTGTS